MKLLAETLTLGLLILLQGVEGHAADATFPGAEWSRRSPADLGVNGGILDRMAEQLGGRGCVVKDGYVIKTWGNQSRVGDWYSSAKPVLSTLLFFAIQEGLVENVDQPIADFGWELKPKDKGITFRHLGSMSSGYARPEGPGKAWSYNDYAIQLYQKTLFDKVYRADAKAVAEDPRRLGALGFQDGLVFNEKRRLFASVRDFSRIAWFWLNKGEWNGRQELPRVYFDEYMKPQTPKDLPQTKTAATDDYLGIGSYGGDSNHFSGDGPGTYGFNWWFNDTGRMHPERLTWPDAPPDTIMSIGARGNCSAFIQSLGVLLVCAEGDWSNEKTNEALRLLTLACRKDAPTATVTGQFRKWHPITLSFNGPDASETSGINPFTDYRLRVYFTHEGRMLVVPGYFAADGRAAETGADTGSVWRAHFVPDEKGKWNYFAEFKTGPGIAIDDSKTAGNRLSFDSAAGSFEVAGCDPNAPGLLAKGFLRAMGQRYPQFAESGAYYIKGGADSPENLLAFADFDGTTPTHRFEPHSVDWRTGDPVWQNGKGKNLIGALNYLASKGMNAVYFLTMNVGGDGRDVWPWISDGKHLRFDCSKLDQWDIVFSHMDRLGLMMHVVTQEQENDQLLDGGKLGPERKLYYRELVARFAHHLAVVWNLGEENTNTHEQRKSFANYLRALDPYHHPIVVHTFPGQYNLVYAPLLGYAHFDGVSLQMGDMTKTHDETRKWVERSFRAGRQWFACQDEIGPPNIGVKPDAEDPEHADVMRHALWGNLMAGGAGAEWFFQSDIHCEDWRTRDRMWDLTRNALQFFHESLPFWEMEPNDEMVQGSNAWCLAKPGDVYAIYTPKPEQVRISLPRGRFQVQWYNPCTGGPMIRGKVLRAGGSRELGDPPNKEEHDWVALIRKRP